MTWYSERLGQDIVLKFPHAKVSFNVEDVHMAWVKLQKIVEVVNAYFALSGPHTTHELVHVLHTLPHMSSHDAKLFETLHVSPTRVTVHGGAHLLGDVHSHTPHALTKLLESDRPRVLLVERSKRVGQVHAPILPRCFVSDA